MEFFRFCIDVELDKSYKYDINKNIGAASRDRGGISTRTTYTNGVKRVRKIPASKSYSIAYVADPNFDIGDISKKKSLTMRR